MEKDLESDDEGTLPDCLASRHPPVKLKSQPSSLEISASKLPPCPPILTARLALEPPLRPAIAAFHHSKIAPLCVFRFKTRMQSKAHTLRGWKRHPPSPPLAAHAVFQHPKVFPACISSLDLSRGCALTPAPQGLPRLCLLETRTCTYHQHPKVAPLYVFRFETRTQSTAHTPRGWKRHPPRTPLAAHAVFQHPKVFPVYVSCLLTRVADVNLTPASQGLFRSCLTI